MGQFRGTVTGGKGEARRIGHKNTGLRTTCQGWESGVSVVGRYDKELNKDVFFIYATGGSGTGAGDGYIGKVIDGKFTPVK